jgi:hypothetical protein
MKATELRIGNYYYHPIALSFERMDDVDFISSFIEKFEPIPLTEEWLLKFGFEATKEANYINVDFSQYSIGDFMVEDNGACYWDFETLGNDLYIETVHQLQNLYHALTGNELTISK